jgi:hypothetical protein
MDQVETELVFESSPKLTMCHLCKLDLSLLSAEVSVSSGVSITFLILTIGTRIANFTLINVWIVKKTQKIQMMISKILIPCPESGVKFVNKT